MNAFRLSKPDPIYPRERSCRDKIGYKSEGLAKRARKWLFLEKGQYGLRVYKCLFCRFWHIGRGPGKL